MTEKGDSERMNQFVAAARNKYVLCLVYKNYNENNHSINFNDPQNCIQNAILVHDDS